MRIILFILMMITFMSYGQDVSNVSDPASVSGVDDPASVSNVDRPVAGEIYTSQNALNSDSEYDTETGLTSVSLDGTGSNVFTSQTTENNSTYAIHASSHDTPTSQARFYEKVDGLLTSGVTYTFSMDAKHTGEGLSWIIGMGSANSNPSGAVIKSLVAGNSTWDTYSVDYEYTGGDLYLVVRENNGSNNGGCYVDNFSITVAP